MDPSPGVPGQCLEARGCTKTCISQESLPQHGVIQWELLAVVMLRDLGLSQKQTFILRLQRDLGSSRCLSKDFRGLGRWFGLPHTHEDSRQSCKKLGRGCVSAVPVLGGGSLELTDKQSSQSVSSSPASDLISESKAESH